MKIRSAFGALCASLALGAALVVSAGTANADVPAFGGHGHGISCTPAAGVSTCDPVTPGGHTLPACTVVAPATTCSDPLGGLGRGLGLGGHGLLGGGLLNGGILNNGLLGDNGLNLIGGNTIVVDGQQVNVCSYPQWDGAQGFYPHFGFAHGDFLRQHAIDQLRYQQLVQQANCGVSGQSINGLTLVNGQWLNLSQYGVSGAPEVNVCSYADYGQFDQFGSRQFGSRFGGFHSRFGGVLGGDGWRELRARANCGSQVVVVPGSDNTTTVEQSPAATVTEAAPAPAASPEVSPETAEAAPASTQVSRVPAGSIETGDGSAPDLN